MNGNLGSGNSLGGVFFGSRCARFSAWVLMVLAIASLATPVRAQRYKEYESRLDRRQVMDLERMLRGAISNRAGFGADADGIKEYFTKHYFLEMTGTSPESLAELGDMRERLFSRYIRVTPNAQSQAFLTELSLKAATVLAQQNFHPAVRYNAALILGNLDQQIARGRPNPTPPIPLPAATAVLLDLLEQEDFKGVKVHPSVQLGALVGLERHARFGIAPQHAERMTKVALDVMAQENPQEEVSQDVHHWMKCRAANLLAYQHQEKPNAEVQTALGALITNETFDLDDRCFVAGLLKLLDYTQAVDIDADVDADIDSTAIVAALGGLSQDVLKAEAKLARDYQQEILGGGGSIRSNLFGGRGGRGRGGGDDQPKYERRQLLSRLKAIYDGGDSLANGAPDAVKSQIQDLLDAMKSVRSAARDNKTTDLDVAEAVIQAAQEVDRVIQSWNQDAAPAEPVEADFS